MQDMIEGYKQTRRMLRALRTLNTDVYERGQLASMVRDCEYALEWLRTGRRPGNKRGVERLAAYQREKLLDPLRMQAFAHTGTSGSPSNLTDFQRYQIEDALSRLSPRERECYVMAHGDCFSFGEIGNILGLSKGTVQEYVERAQRKISEDLMCSLFLNV